MTHTVKQYAIFRIPINPEAFIDPSDAWLFREPFKVFELHTPLPTILKEYNKIKAHGPRLVGQGKIEARPVLKSRQVHFTNYTKVIGADA